MLEITNVNYHSKLPWCRHCRTWLTQYWQQVKSQYEKIVWWKLNTSCYIVTELKNGWRRASATVIRSEGLYFSIQLIRSISWRSLTLPEMTYDYNKQELPFISFTVMLVIYAAMSATIYNNHKTIQHFQA